MAEPASRSSVLVSFTPHDPETTAREVREIQSWSAVDTRIMERLMAQLGGDLTHADNRPGPRTEIIVPVEAPKWPT